MGGGLMGAQVMHVLSLGDSDAQTGTWAPLCKSCM